MLYDYKIHAYHIKLLYFCEDVNLTLVIFLIFQRRRINRSSSYYTTSTFYFRKNVGFVGFAILIGLDIHCVELNAQQARNIFFPGKVKQDVERREARKTETVH